MSVAVWFTGLSGAGKTTVSRLVEERLKALGLPVVRLDGDELRARPQWRLGFTRQDREEQTRRLGLMAARHVREGAICLVAAIAPFAAARNEVRRALGDMIEVWCRADLETLAAKDVKGLYARALRGEIVEFTGVSSPYEPPENPEVTVFTYLESPEESANRVAQAIAERLGVPGNDR